MKFTITTLVALLLALSSAAAPLPQAPSQNPPTGQGPEKKDPFAKFEPRSAPGAGQAYLSKFVGEFAVAKTFYPRTGNPTRLQGTCKQSMVHDGRFLQSDFTFQQDGKVTDGRGMIGFEPESGLFTSVWTDSRQTRMSFRRSREKFDGTKIVLYSSSLDPQEKDPRRSKTVSLVEDAGTRIVHRQYSLGPGGEERLMMELILTRK